jgi:hypothetical protein
MKTFTSALFLIMITFSFSAFAGFNTGEQNLAYPGGFAAKKLSINGHSVELGRDVQDAFGNFSDEEISTLIPLLTQTLEKLPSRAELRVKNRLRLVIQVVKGPRFNVERQAERGYLRMPALTRITLTIPQGAMSSDVALFFNENLTVYAPPAAVESKTNNIADFMKNLVSPRDLNGCEMHLLNLIAPY